MAMGRAAENTAGLRFIHNCAGPAAATVDIYPQIVISKKFLMAVIRKK
jgi:hypothetical protein